jgi:Transmembrane protein of unknown function (DUF3556)
MGFLSPQMPPFNLHFWHWGRRSERLEPLCHHWGEYGFGLPWVIYPIYAVKLACYLGGALFFITLTSGIGSLEAISSWWTQPVVFQKAAIWSLLFEVVGLGSGFGPLTGRFLPPIGGVLYWLRPRTVRLPPWPGRVPFTRGSTRTWFDVVLYGGLLLACGWLLLSPAEQLDTGMFGVVALLKPTTLIPLAVLLGLVGLRDKTIFLAARSELYGTLLLLFFLPFADMIVAAKLFLVLMWWGSGTSKLSKAFTFNMAVQFSQTLIAPRALRRRMFRAFPEDMLPSWTARVLGVICPAIEFGAPLALLVTRGATMALVAIGVLVAMHVLTITMVPMGAPGEWNAFIIFALLYLFQGHSGMDLATADHRLVPLLAAVPLVTLIVWGNLRPDQISYLPAMRYYSGNWAVSVWAMQPSALSKIDTHVVKYGGFAKSQLKALFGEQIAELVEHKIFTFRALYPHGRALFGLLPRAVGSMHEEAVVLEGEVVAHAILGWSFGEGHLHNEQLAEALNERCHFEPGEVRVVVLESVPLGADRQPYRLVDAATGELERGYVLVRDMTNHQPWEIDNLPVYISR